MRFEEGDEPDVFWACREGNVEHSTPTAPNATLSATVSTRDVTSFRLPRAFVFSGERFIFNLGPSASVPTHYNVVLNWFEELKHRASR
jgi:hypothetical protein